LRTFKCFGCGTEFPLEFKKSLLRLTFSKEEVVAVITTHCPFCERTYRFRAAGKYEEVKEKLRMLEFL
jgi:transposase-like protein